MAEKICTHCGYEGKRKKRLRGSKLVSNILWWVFFIPGPFYSIWRHTGVQKECPHCHLPTLVKINSDAGVMARRKFDIELGFIQPVKREAQLTDPLQSFGNEKPQVEITKKKPADPEDW